MDPLIDKTTARVAMGCFFVFVLAWFLTLICVGWALIWWLLK